MRPAVGETSATTDNDATARVFGRVDALYTAFETWLPVTLLTAASLLGLATVVLRYGFGIGFAWAQGVLILIPTTMKSSKLQNLSSKEAPGLNSQIQCANVGLELGIWSLFGAWNLEPGT